MSWINDLSADNTTAFATIKGLLRQQDGLCLEEFISFIRNKLNQGVAQNTSDEVTVIIDSVDLAIKYKLCFNMEDLDKDSNSSIYTACLLRLKNLGLVYSIDEINFGLTALGVDFIEAMQISTP